MRIDKEADKNLTKDHKQIRSYSGNIYISRFWNNPYISNGC